MKSISSPLCRMPFFRIGILAFAAALSALACKFPTPEGPTPTDTPAPPDLPTGWDCYQNLVYGFEVCYSPGAYIDTTSDEHSQIGIPFPMGTNLVSKWMDVDSRAGLAECESPLGEGYAGGGIAMETQTINGLEFLVQTAEDGAAGSLYHWTGWSTERDGVCVSLTGVLESRNALFYPTPPPEYDPAAENEVFVQMVETFRWLDPPEPTISAGWLCYQNELYAFEVCYPPDASITTDSDAHSRITFNFPSGTNLVEEWMDADSREGEPDCASPMAEGYAAGSVTEGSWTVNGLDFRVQSGHEGAAGSQYDWRGYSTERDGVCVSLTGVLQSTNPAMYSTPPPEFDMKDELVLFDRVVATFRWLDETAPTASAKDSAAATLTANANCRRGATLDHEIVTFLRAGQTVPIVGQNEDGSWWLVQVPGTGIRCWVGGSNVQPSGDLTAVPFVESPILGCWVQGPNDKRPRCAAPCPAGAKPGGVCEP